MKILVVLFLFSISAILHAQWQSDMRLTNDPNISYTANGNAWTLAKTSNYLNIIWRDTRHVHTEIYYKRSSDNGSSWTADIRLTDFNAQKFTPAIAGSSQTLHAVWSDWRVGDEEIYYKRSSDEGASWGPDTRLSNALERSLYPSIAVSGQNVYVVWQDYRDGPTEIYYKSSTNDGLTWSADIKLSNTWGTSDRPSIAVSGQNIYVVWQDLSFGGNKTCYKRSTNNGINWSADTNICTVQADALDPCISAFGSNVSIVWSDRRHGGTEIYFKNSSNGGASWNSELRLTDDPAFSDRPSITVSGGNVHIVWTDTRFGNDEILYKQSTDAGINWGPDIRLTNSAGGSTASSVITSGNNVYVGWYDGRDGNPEVYFKRNPTGNLTGISTINSEIPNSYILVQNYPNPFNPSTRIQFAVPKQSRVLLKIYDITGRVIETSMNNTISAGNYEYVFDSKNLSSGIYYYSLYSDGKLIDTKKMVLLK
jgi:hypothetical protein